jgi:F420-dependent oxidoreductase-like protein
MIGVYVQGGNATETLQAIKDAEAAGVPSFWLTTGGQAPDVPTLYAAAAMVTQNIKMGTSITQTWPRHPVAVVSQCVALAQLAPGRFRIGLGPSHAPAVENMYGVPYKKPLLNLREYLTVIRTLLHKGEIEFAGTFVKTNAKIPGAPFDVPVMASALRPASFRLCGELADGAISWVSPWDYLRDIALPAMVEGAESAKRPTPTMVAHMPVALTADRAAVRETAGAFLGRYAGMPNYQGMFAAAGFHDVAAGDRNALVDAVVVRGSDSEVIERLASIVHEGAGEIIAHPIYIGDDRDAYTRRFYDVVVKANKAAGIKA